MQNMGKINKLFYLALFSPLVPQQNCSIKRSRYEAVFARAQAKGDNPRKGTEIFGYIMIGFN